MVLDVIWGHSATVPKLPVDARAFAGHPEGTKLNKTMSLPTWECCSPPKRENTAIGIVVIPASVWAQPGENSEAGGKGQSAFLF